MCILAHCTQPGCCCIRKANSAVLSVCETPLPPAPRACPARQASGTCRCLNVRSAGEVSLVAQVGEVAVGAVVLGVILQGPGQQPGGAGDLCRGWCGTGRLGWQEGLVTRGGSEGGRCRGVWEEEDLPRAGQDLVGGATDGPGSRSEGLGSW